MADDSVDVRVDVVIPTRNEEAAIVDTRSNQYPLENGVVSLDS